MQNIEMPSCYSLISVDREGKVVFQRTESGKNVLPLFYAALNDAKALLLPQLQAFQAGMRWTDGDEAKH